jgi:hypothetical protein
MGLITIDVCIGDTLQAIDEIFARHGLARAKVWESLEHQLQAVEVTVGSLDSIYLNLLAEIENIFAQPKPSAERITNIISQANTYCTNEMLTLSLVDARGEIQSAAFNRTLKHRRYRVLCSTLRSIDDPLGKYIERLKHLQAADAPEAPAHDQQWDLRTVLELLKSMNAQLANHGDTGKDLSTVGEACEEAIRNYNRALSLVLTQLIGHAKQDLALDRL